jgi:hypothetical protein
VPPLKNECKECGQNSFYAKDYERVLKYAERIEKRFESNAVERARREFRLELKIMELENAKRHFQRKAAKQGTVIARLEKKLRDMGAAPYEPTHAEIMRRGEELGKLLEEDKAVLGPIPKDVQEEVAKHWPK